MPTITPFKASYIAKHATMLKQCCDPDRLVDTNHYYYRKDSNLLKCRRYPTDRYPTDTPIQPEAIEAVDSGADEAEM